MGFKSGFKGLINSSLLYDHGNTFPADSADDCAPELLLRAYCYIPILALIVYVKQPNGLVSSEGYQVVITTNLVLNGMQGTTLCLCNSTVGIELDVSSQLYAPAAALNG